VTHISPNADAVGSQHFEQWLTAVTGSNLYLCSSCLLSDWDLFV